MKRYACHGLLAIIIFLVTSFIAGAATSIKNTKHDLSRGSTGATIKAASSGTTEICVFCHTPHSAKPDAPLWNRSDVFGSYTVYTSDILQGPGSLGYPLPDQPTTKLGAGAADVHVKTRICLSCHDGTIALGHLVNLPSPYLNDIQMVGATNEKLPLSAAGYMGTDLRDDHPVAVKYLSGLDPELAAAPPGQLKLYTSGDYNYVECTTCHNAHDNTNGNFLVMSNRNSALCTGCHASKKGYETSTSSIHATSSVSYSPPDGVGGYLGTKVGGTSSEGGVLCMDCHFPHKAGVDSGTPTTPNPASGKYLLSFREDQTCFNNQNRWGQTVSVCHGSNATLTKNIQTQVGKWASSSRSAHNVEATYSGGNYVGKHQALEHVSSGYGWLGSGNTNWHVECSDCHNSHTAGDTKHSPGTNAISTGSSPLYGAGGVPMNFSSSNWPTMSSIFFGTPFESLGLTTSSSMPGNYYEYQICMKCHSSFAWSSGVAPPLSDLWGITNMTDQALEFNTGNKSYHSVTGLNSGRFQPPTGSWINGWNAADLMYCSDCHGTDDSTAPQGPHGSNNAGMLIYPYSDTYGTGGGAAQDPNDLCLRCHAPAVYLTAGLNTPANLSTGFASTGDINLHTQHAYRAQGQGYTQTPINNPLSYKCVNCHTRVPHGWKRRGMIVFNGDGAGFGGAYEAGGTNTGRIDSTSTLPATQGNNQYGAAINANCTTGNAFGIGCHRN